MTTAAPRILSSASILRTMAGVVDAARRLGLRAFRWVIEIEWCGEGQNLCSDCLEVYDTRSEHRVCPQQVYGYCTRCKTARPLDRRAQCRSCGEGVALWLSATRAGVWERMRGER